MYLTENMKQHSPIFTDLIMIEEITVAKYSQDFKILNCFYKKTYALNPGNIYSTFLKPNGIGAWYDYSIEYQ